MRISKTQIDRLGDRLKAGSHSDSDLRLLDEYRSSFDAAYRAVVQMLRQHGAVPSGRPAKATQSIVEKLRRESIRLSQMQDVAGCRVIVSDVIGQDKFVASLQTDFPDAMVMDRREKPSHGYRAVHVIAQVSGKPIEIQVRTSLQQMWAELSERASDALDPAIKYGGGPDEWRTGLPIYSAAVAGHERLEKAFAALETSFAELEQANNVLAEQVASHARRHPEKLSAELEHKIQKARITVENWARERDSGKLKLEQDRRELRQGWSELADSLRGLISSLDDMKRQKR